MSLVFPFDPNIERASTVPARVYNDPVFLELERERIFARTWQLVGRVEDVKEHGQFITAQIENDIRLAKTLAAEVDRRPDFERMAESVLSIANFRYHPREAGLSDEALDALNRRIVNRLVGDGSFFLAPTILKGRTTLRVSITNFRTREEDLFALLDESSRIGRELLTAPAVT